MEPPLEEMEGASIQHTEKLSCDSVTGESKLSEWDTVKLEWTSKVSQIEENPFSPPAFNQSLGVDCPWGRRTISQDEVAPLD